MISVRTVPGIRGGGKKQQWMKWIQVWYIWHTVRTFVNATISPTQHNNKKKEKKNQAGPKWKNIGLTFTENEKMRAQTLQQRKDTFRREHAHSRGGAEQVGSPPNFLPTFSADLDYLQYFLATH
jgi:hypothetical protein